MSADRIVIEEPARRPPLLRWRDRCLSFVLWAVWGRPVEALARLTAGDSGLSVDLVWTAFTADLVVVAGLAGFLVSLLLGWGVYGRLQTPAAT
jgi:hypothetical protein